MNNYCGGCGMFVGSVMVLAMKKLAKMSSINPKDLQERSKFTMSSTYFGTREYVVQAVTERGVLAWWSYKGIKSIFTYEELSLNRGFVITGSINKIFYFLHR